MDTAVLLDMKVKHQRIRKMGWNFKYLNYVHIINIRFKA